MSEFVPLTKETMEMVVRGPMGAIELQWAKTALYWQERAEELEKERDTILSGARVWAGEAKTQRATVNEVGALLGGRGDWTGIAAQVRERIQAAEEMAREATDELAQVDAVLARRLALDGIEGRVEKIQHALNVCAKYEPGREGYSKPREASP